jgi:dihydroorotate dehydrogenase
MDEHVAMDALTRFSAWQVVAARIQREVDSIQTNLISVPNIDKLRQLQGQAQALENLLAEIKGAHDILRRQG